MPATSAMPAEAFGPSPMAFSTISVVTSELPGTPAPADEATIVVSTIVAIWPAPRCDAVQVREEHGGRRFVDGGAVLVQRRAGRQHEARRLPPDTPSRSRAAAMLTGSVTLDEAVENASSSTWPTACRNATTPIRAPN